MPNLDNTEFVNFREKKATADISDLPAINDVVVNVDITTEPGKAIVMFESGKILKVENVTQEPVQVPVQVPVREPGAGDLNLNLNMNEPIVKAGTIIIGAISKEERKEYTDFAKVLKQKLKKHIKDPFGVSVSIHNPRSKTKSYPYIQVMMKGDGKISNDFRTLVAKGLDIKNILNWDDIDYGNITKNNIALYYSEWKKLEPKL